MKEVDEIFFVNFCSGTAKGSRLEYSSLNGRYRDDYDFQIDLKTGTDEGIIFYASDPYDQNLIAVYVMDGKVKRS